MQQLQRPTTERVLLADFHVELRSLLSLLGNWQPDQFVYNTRTNFERSNYAENCAYYNGISTVLYNEYNNNNNNDRLTAFDPGQPG